MQAPPSFEAASEWALSWCSCEGRFNARLATKDVDAVILAPGPASHVRVLARAVRRPSGNG